MAGIEVDFLSPSYKRYSFQLYVLVVLMPLAIF